MKKLLAFLLTGFLATCTFAQTNEFLTNPLAVDILKGNYDPALYHQGANTAEEQVISGLIRDVSKDQLVDHLLFLDTFHNRNTGSDTTSLDTGIGAARTWILSWFDLLSRQNNNRLVTGYLEFDAVVCGTDHHKNPFAILPGSDTSLNEVIVIEGHFDTRNEDGCDTQGYTPGSDDNGSGTVLVMEAARLLAGYSFPRTIIFTTPTGEDQGLWGAKAWANYLSDNNINVIACLNNDVVGGITCGKTSSPPSCPYEGHVDSTHVRVFSYSPGNSTRTFSPHKQLARLIKIIQEERLNPLVETPMTINIMGSEDRSGRSGDHIPFRQKGIPAIRFCSANEHGNGGGSYPDRQHSTRDVLGQDLDQDGFLDTLFVDPGYLSRNLLINCATLANLASAPENPLISFVPIPSGVKIRIENPNPAITKYWVGVRYVANRSHQFDELKLVDATEEFDLTVEPSSRSYISVAPVIDGFTGMFGEEYELDLMSVDPFDLTYGCRISKVYPNPAGNRLTVDIMNGSASGKAYQLSIRDLTGRLLHEVSFTPDFGDNSLIINMDGMAEGYYLASVNDGSQHSQPVRFIKARNN